MATFPRAEVAIRSLPMKNDGPRGTFGDMPDNTKIIEAARESLKRVQEFDVESLPRVERLGEDYNFRSAVGPASRLIGLFRQFPEQFVVDLPANQLSTLKQYADSTFNYFHQIADFDPKASDAYSTRQNLISSLDSHYQGVFDAISPLISFGSSRLRDFSQLEAQARAAIQAAKDEADLAAKGLQTQQDEAKRILEDIRQIAAEQGVSQQSIYFKTEYEDNETNAETWRWRTTALAIGLGAFALLSVFAHKWSFLAPITAYDTAQLAISKILIFAVIGFMLVLAARNFLACKHNAIINRHRYNALLTFKALADAAGSEERRDIVLTYAASCIFAPQETGYSKTGEKTEIVPGIIQSIPKLGGAEK